ncbi:MAG: secretin N-terminal domain-containing protein, partial [Planctomycetota bacterium]
EVSEPAKVSEPNQAADADTARARADRRRPGPPMDKAKPEAAKAADPNGSAESGEQMEAVNLKDVEMKKIIDKIATWTGKTVIPHDDAMKQKITIYAPEKLPRAKALEKIYSALRMKNFVAEEVDGTIFLKPIADAKMGMVPTVAANEPLAAFENKDKIVRKFFKLASYPPAQMSEIVRPLVGEYGHVSADEGSGTLLVIDTVANLISIQRIIGQFDVAGAGQTVEEFFEVKHGDPLEIVQLLRMLMGEPPRPSSRGRSSSSYRGRVSPSSSRGAPSSKGKSSGTATSVVVGTGDVQLVLIPVPKARWIIARGAPDDVKQIHDWIEKLDRQEPVTSESETVAIQYANPREVAQRIEDALQEMPGNELTPNILVRSLDQSRKIMIIGRPDLRDMVKKMIAEIDVPSGVFETKVFDLEHADPEQIKENVDSLYGEEIPQYDSYYYYRYGRGSRGADSDTVKVIAFPTMGQVTVIASPENMRKIEKQIDEWDTPLEVEAVKPRIIELRNSDPVQMADLLTKLFSEDQDSSSNFFRIFFYGRGGDERKKIVGPLYGQLTFEEVPGTKKIIVISKIPEAYDVVEQLIYDLDRQEMAEIPNVVPLQYADPEDLAERLNAMFNEPGTTARIRRRITGLSEYTMDGTSGNQGGGPSNNNNQGGGGNPDEYTPWWSAGARQRPDEEPISNVIGKVRFIPDPRSKSILVLAAPEFQDSLEKT